jgi:hypothetical protein
MLSCIRMMFTTDKDETKEEWDELISVGQENSTPIELYYEDPGKARGADSRAASQRGLVGKQVPALLAAGRR